MSEFGEGLTYCLGLFLAHESRYWRDKEVYKKENISQILIDDLPWSWFNASSDHLYDLQIPKNYPSATKKRLNQFKDSCLGFGHGFPRKKVSEKDVEWAINECKQLLIIIDAIIGVSVTKGDYE